MNYEPFVLERTFKAPRVLVWADAGHDKHFSLPNEVKNARV